jgi:DNA mismatch endonuclease, patch repair protein
MLESDMDIFTKDKRSAIMRSVRSHGTKPELAVAKLLRSLKIRYRSHPKNLPGNPDFVLLDHATVVFIHGCFWHQHKRCGKAEIPADNRRFWVKKLKRNVERDRQSVRHLRRCGLGVVTLWECEMKSPEFVALRLQKVIKTKLL